MAFTFPDAGRIANIGHINAVTVLSTDQFQEYVLYGSAPRASFFTKDFAYTYDGVSLVPSAGADDCINIQAVRQAVEDADQVHMHHGSKHTLFKHAFKMGKEFAFDANYPFFFAGKKVPMGGATVQIYGVFLDAETGFPLPHWRTNPEDGAVEMLYEFFSDGAQFLSSVDTARDLCVAMSLGSPGYLAGHEGAWCTLVGGPASYEVNGIRYVSPNAVVLEDSGPCLHGTRASEALARWDGAAEAPVRLVRASDNNVQTLVFAVVKDATTAAHGITDAFALYRCVPAGWDAKRASMYTSRSGPGSEITFEDSAIHDLGGGSACAYVRKLLTKVQCDDGDDTRAKRMHFPPVDVSLTLSSPNGGKVDLIRKLSPANVHRAMPRGNLGTRLLQMFSVLCATEYCPIKTNLMNMDSETASKYNIRSALAQMLDLTNEPAQTHDGILDAMRLFFQDPAKRLAFMKEFDAKFPGVLTNASALSAGPLGGVSSGSVAQALASSAPDAKFAVAVYLTIEFCVPDPSHLGSMKSCTINNVPIVFALS